ncbi:MAG: Crp/Fnr family transcriptional regulator [Paracoccaceae bacterium]|nr:Crp/Fnr family transcriptional regulator [Paracoccaceae bacterium]
MPGIRKLNVPKGQIIFQRGQACPGFVVLKEGTIKVTLAGPSGREVVLYRVRSGEICLQTLSCLINGEPYGAEGVAETEIAGELVPANEFHKKFADDAEFRDRIMASVATRFAEYQRLVEEVALTSFDARLAKVLLRMAGSGDFVATTHSALAAETASGRAYVTRRLAEFAKSGLVEQEEDGIALRNRKRLEQLAAGER